MGKFIYRVHAIRRMFERKITTEDVTSVVSSGKVLESYPDDSPYPSRLLLGWVGERPLHVVAAEDEVNQQTIIITVYEPGAERWYHDFERRKK